MIPGDLQQIRTRVSDLLNRMGSQLLSDTPDEALQSQVAKLGLIAAGLAVVDAESLPAESAGFGSIVEAENVDTGETEEYELMVGSLVDVGTNQVSLASPIGQALLGRTAGDEVMIVTPYKQARMRINRVVTLAELLDRYEV
jgi:transcription elongation GreA/GreB family factor